MPTKQKPATRLITRATTTELICENGDRPRDGVSYPASATPPKTSGRSFKTPHGLVVLSARELATCAEVNADPQAYANRKGKLAAERAGRVR